MTPDQAKVKCRKFLSFLLEDYAKHIAEPARVKALVQGLIDERINEVDFSNQLQKPCLVGFLKVLVPL